MPFDGVHHTKYVVQTLSATEHRGHKLSFVAGGHLGVAHDAAVILHPAEHGDVVSVAEGVVSGAKGEAGTFAACCCDGHTGRTQLRA